MSEPSYGGQFVWYDLMTDDVDAAKSFYTDLVGWTLTPFEGAPETYDMWTADAPVGGVMKLPAEVAAMGAPPHWIGYVATGDVDATVAKAEELGATVLEAGQDIPDVGRFAVLRDPQGAVFKVYASSESEWQPPSHPSPGHMSWHELATTDYQAAWDFYSRLFGWTKTEDMEMDGGMVYRMFRGSGEIPLGGMFDKPPEMPACAWMYYIMVPDVDAAAEKVKELGGQILNGPMEVPGGDRIVQCVDNRGAAFALHSTA